MTETMTPKLASAASIAGRTPGRLRISRSGAAGPSGDASSTSRASRSAMRCGSGRTRNTRATAMRLIPPAASQGTESALASTSRPANSGPNTAGPRIAPNTEPNRT